MDKGNGREFINAQEFLVLRVLLRPELRPEWHLLKRLLLSGYVKNA